MNLSSFTMKVLAASLVLASTTGLAFAKNYKGEANYKGEMAVPCPAPRMLMAGWYVGGQVGYDSYRVRKSISIPALGISSNPVINGTSWAGGLYLGWGAYWTDWFYLGAELNGSWSGVNTQHDIVVAGISNYNNRFESNGNWGVALLPGFRLNDASLGYVRLGWNWASLEGRQGLTFPLAGVGFSSNTHHTSNGFVWGVGIETLLVDNWSIRTEYDHTFYNNFSNSFLGINTTYKPSDNQFMVGVSYHFG